MADILPRIPEAFAENEDESWRKLSKTASGNRRKNIIRHCFVKRKHRATPTVGIFFRTEITACSSRFYCSTIFFLICRLSSNATSWQCSSPNLTQNRDQKPKIWTFLRVSLGFCHDLSRKQLSANLLDFIVLHFSFPFFSFPFLSFVMPLDVLLTFSCNFYKKKENTVFECVCVCVSVSIGEIYCP